MTPSTRRRAWASWSVAAALGGALVVSGVALAQPEPGQLPPGHPAINPPPGRQLPPSLQPPHGPSPHGVPMPMPAPRHPAAEPAEEEHAEAGHCPGHGPDDPPPPPNWWRGLVMVNNERAQSDSFVNQLLFRYENPKDACDPKNQPPPFLASMLNFGLLAFLLVHFGKKPLAEALVKRKESIMGEIETATRLKKDAQKRLREYQRQFETIDEKLESMKADHAAQSQAEKRRILAEAEERRARMKRDAELRIEQELKAARQSLMGEAVDGAVAAAQALLASKVGPGDLERSADDYLGVLASAMGGRRSGGGKA